MTQPQEIIDGVVTVLKNSDNIPDVVNFINKEPDVNSNPIKLPFIQVSGEVKVNVDATNSNKIDTISGSNSETLKEVYETLYTQEFNVAVWTAQGSSNDVKKLSASIRNVLFEYTTAGPDRELPDPNGDGTLDDVWNVRLLETERTDDLGTSPTARKRTEVIEVSAGETFITEDKETIEGVELI